MCIDASEKTQLLQLFSPAMGPNCAARARTWCGRGGRRAGGGRISISVDSSGLRSWSKRLCRGAEKPHGEPELVSRRERARGLFSQLAVLSPLTVRGFLVALLSGVFLWTHGYGALDLILFVVGVSGLALVSLCLIAVGVGALFVRRSTAPLERSDTQHLEAGTLHQTGFSRPGLQRLPLVHLSWQVERPAAVDAVQALEAEVLTEAVTPWRRCAAPALGERSVRLFSV